MKAVIGFGANPSAIDPVELQDWFLFEDENLLVVNKPGWVVCHPSKDGPWSSLVGACKAYLGLSKLHLVARLDRETSGVVLLAKNPRTARKLQMALEHRRVGKDYLALLEGTLPDGQKVITGSLVRDKESPVFVKQRVATQPGGLSASTCFYSLIEGVDCTLALVLPETGRKHQIRAHAQWMGAPVSGDKIYGPDPSCFLEFIEKGWTHDLQARLGFNRQVLHAFRMSFFFEEATWFFTAP